MKPHWLLDHAFDTYSQSGEDGIIARILSLLPERDRWCVDVGAWDGIHFSNVRRLILEEGYAAVLIEGDPQKAEALRRNYLHERDIHAVNAVVGFDVDSGLDRILSARDVPERFDFLSIDIDGNDYFVWEELREHRPKVICIEFNPTIPSAVTFIQPRDLRVNQGSSLLALDALAHAKGYELVCVLPWNAFFVDEKYFAAFEIGDNSPHVLRKDDSQVSWLFVGYDGSVHVAGAARMPWHGIAIDERRVQILPWFLRSYPDNYTAVQRTLFRLMKKLGILKT